MRVSRCLVTKALLLLLGLEKGGKWRSSCPGLGRKEMWAALLSCGCFMCQGGHVAGKNTF